MASLWDMIPEEEDLSCLVKSDNPDFEKILLSPDLFPSFKHNEEYLINFFTTTENLEHLIQVILKEKNEKVSRLGVELFMIEKSPLLQTFLKNPQNVAESICSYISDKDYLHTGYISRIYSKGIESFPEIAHSLFSKSNIIISSLIKNIHISSITDLLWKYINSLPIENQWLIWVFFLSVLPTNSKTENSIWSKYSSNIQQFQFTAKANQQPLILDIIYRFIIENQKNEKILQQFSSQIYLLYSSCSQDCSLFFWKIARSLPYNSDLFKEALKLSISPLPYNESIVSAIEYLADNAEQCYSSQNISLFKEKMKKISQLFIDDKTNTFHHIAYLHLVTNTSKDTTLKNLWVQILGTALKKLSKSQNWRKNVSKVAFYLELSTVLKSAGSFDEIENELSLWSHKDDIPPNVPRPAASSFDVNTIDNVSKTKSNTQTSSSNQSNTNSNTKTNTTTTNNNNTNTNNNNNNNNNDNNSFDFPTDFSFAPATNNEKKEEILFGAAEPDDNNDNINNNNNSDNDKNNNNNSFDFPSDFTFDQPKPKESNDQIFFGSVDDNESNDQKKEEKSNNNNNSFEFPTDFSFDAPKTETNKKEEVLFGNVDENNDDDENKDSKTNNNNDNNAFEFPTDFNFEAPKTDSNKKEEVLFGTANDSDNNNNDNNNSFEFPADFEFKKEQNITNTFEFPSNIVFDGNSSETKTEIKPKREINEEKITFEKFYELTHDPCWDYNGPTPAELFAQKDQFANADEAFEFLMKEH